MARLRRLQTLGQSEGGLFGTTILSSRVDRYFGDPRLSRVVVLETDREGHPHIPNLLAKAIIAIAL
jgi:hypothetical protein